MSSLTFRSSGAMAMPVIPPGSFWPLRRTVQGTASPTCLSAPPESPLSRAAMVRLSTTSLLTAIRLKLSASTVKRMVEDVPAPML